MILETLLVLLAGVVVESLTATPVRCAYFGAHLVVAVREVRGDIRADIAGDAILAHVTRMNQLVC